MLNVRVVTTPGLTARLLGRLADLPGIRNLIVLEGAARPSGDAVFFDVDHSAANRGGAVYSPSFFGLFAIAGLIGAVGILTNSQILIVGAMVVGPPWWSRSWPGSWAWYP